MDLSTSLSGIRAGLNSLGVRNHNLANIHSKGYKSKRVVLSENGGNGVRITSISADRSQGGLASTGYFSDVALFGKGMFELEGPQGEKVFKRSLNLHTGGDGQIRDTESGYALKGLSGNFPAGSQISVAEDGTVYQTSTGKDPVAVGKVTVVSVSNPDGLKSAGNGVYFETANSGPSQSVSPGVDQKVMQGYEETSNVDLAREMTGQIVDEKIVTANIRAIQAQDRMLGDLLDLKG